MQRSWGQSRLVITYNGELYNFRELRGILEKAGECFDTHSDTEVVLAAYRRWGPRAFEHFEAMFALGLYDEANRRLILARDRFGEKPLYYYADQHEVAFGSTLKSVCRVLGRTPEISLEALNLYLAFGYVPHPWSMLQGIRKLPQGAYLTVDLATMGTELTHYWRPDLLSPPPQFPGETAPTEEVDDELLQLIEQAVLRRTVSDVGYGIFLSGGLDSSIITAIAARHTPRLRTFSARFEGAPDGDLPNASLITRHFGTEHTDLTITAADLGGAEEALQSLDEPLGDSSIIPTYLISRQARSGLKVALGGDGGDELFGGYNLYAEALRDERILHLMPYPVRRLLSGAGHLLPRGIAGRRSLLRLGFRDLTGAVADRYVRMPAAERVRFAPVLSQLPPDQLSLPERLRCEGLREIDRDLIHALSLHDLQYYLPDDILTKVDRASMQVSLEVRAPFLDKALVEFVLTRYPSSLKVGASGRKIGLRRLSRRLLPAGVVFREKHGFGLPLHVWRRELTRLAEQALPQLDPALFDPDTAGRLAHAQRVNPGASHLVFQLMAFSVWHTGLRSGDWGS
jgi:asparagine synthase (glutamine-hydrolysing)